MKVAASFFALLLLPLAAQRIPPPTVPESAFDYPHTPDVIHSHHRGGQTLILVPGQRVKIINTYHVCEFTLQSADYGLFIYRGSTPEILGATHADLPCGAAEDFTIWNPSENWRGPNRVELVWHLER